MALPGLYLYYYYRRPSVAQWWPQDIQKKLNTLEKYACLNELKLNSKKQKIMCFKRRGSSKQKFKINEHIIEIVKFSSSSLFRSMAESSVSKAKQAIRSVIPLLTKQDLLTWGSSTTIFNSTIFNCFSANIAI